MHIHLFKVYRSILPPLGRFPLEGRLKAGAKLDTSPESKQS